MVDGEQQGRPYKRRLSCSRGQNEDGCQLHGVCWYREGALSYSAGIFDCGDRGGLLRMSSSTTLKNPVYSRDLEAGLEIVTEGLRALHVLLEIFRE